MMLPTLAVTDPFDPTPRRTGPRRGARAREAPPAAPPGSSDPLGEAEAGTLRLLAGHLALEHAPLLRPLVPAPRAGGRAPACALALEACARALGRPEGRRMLDELLAAALAARARAFVGRSIAELAEAWGRDGPLLERAERTALLWLVARRSGPGPRPLERRIRRALAG